MFDPTTTAFVFPGQGSQFVGMGRELAQASAAARQTFEEADSYLGFALSKLCWDGPEADLNDTINTQPALYTCSVAAWRALYEKMGEVTPKFVAGHSLGELSALTAAGAMEFEDGVALVRKRGEAMKAAGLWEALQPKLVYANNISMAKQLAATGNADAAFTAYSLVMKETGAVVKVDSRLYTPIEQALGVLAASRQGQRVRQFAAFMLGVEGRAMLAKRGYLVP